MQEPPGESLWNGFLVQDRSVVPPERPSFQPWDVLSKEGSGFVSLICSPEKGASWWLLGRVSPKVAQELGSWETQGPGLTAPEPTPGLSVSVK